VTGLDKQYSTSRRHDSYWKANTTEEKIPKFIDFLLSAGIIQKLMEETQRL